MRFFRRERRSKDVSEHKEPAKGKMKLFIVCV